tara:strand:- start:162 stop:386 length:225 start_codon:yes stop_codon:yes gene_type:complete
MKHGYTLAELLMMVVLLSILYAMYLTVITDAKRSADFAVCAHYKKEFRTLKELNEYAPMVKVANRCYDCHATEP